MLQIKELSVSIMPGIFFFLQKIRNPFQELDILKLTGGCMGTLLQRHRAMCVFPATAALYTSGKVTCTICISLMHRHAGRCWGVLLSDTRAQPPTVPAVSLGALSVNGLLPTSISSDPCGNFTCGCLLVTCCTTRSVPAQPRLRRCAGAGVSIKQLPPSGEPGSLRPRLHPEGLNGTGYSHKCTRTHAHRSASDIEKKKRLDPSLFTHADRSALAVMPYQSPFHSPQRCQHRGKLPGHVAQPQPRADKTHFT